MKQLVLAPGGCRVPVHGRCRSGGNDGIDRRDQRRVVDFDDYTEIAFGAPNADFGSVLAYQAPRVVRFGARFAF